MRTSDSIVIIPTYNEKENIENIIRAVLGLEESFNILIIDDGSPDGTAAIVKGLMENEFKEHNRQNFGYERFTFLYLEDSLTAEGRKERLVEAIKTYFND